MENKLRPSNKFVANNLPTPNRIKPAVDTSNFKKFHPRIISKRTSQPSPTIERKKPNNIPLIKSRLQSPPEVKQPPKVLVKVVQEQNKSIKIIRQQQPPKKSALPVQGANIKRDIRRPDKIVSTRKHHPQKTNKPVNRTNPNIERFKNVGNNKILIMIAAGPSVGEVDFTPIKDNQLIDVMCINQPYSKLWPTQYWAFCDHTQFVRNESVWHDYKGVIFNSTNVRAHKGNQYVLSSIPGKGFSLDILNGYHIGRSSTYANMQIALYMGYEKIYIFGCDMAGVNGVMHYYGQNPDVSNDRRQERFAAEAEHYTWAAKNLPQRIRERFIFCSSYNPWPFIQDFKKLDHKLAIQSILEECQRMSTPAV